MIRRLAIELTFLLPSSESISRFLLSAKMKNMLSVLELEPLSMRAYTNLLAVHVDKISPILAGERHCQSIYFIFCAHHTTYLTTIINKCATQS